MASEEGAVLDAGDTGRNIDGPQICALRKGSGTDFPDALRDGDHAKTGAAREGIRPDPEEVPRTGELEVPECKATIEGPVLNVANRVRNRDTRQRLTPLESRPTYGLHCIGDDRCLAPEHQRLPVIRETAVPLRAENGVSLCHLNNLQGAASAESCLFNLQNACRQVNLSEIPATLERLAPDAGKGLWENYFTKVVAAVELIIFNVVSPLWDDAFAVDYFKSFHNLLILPTINTGLHGYRYPHFWK